MKVFSYYLSRKEKAFWFRLFGYGLSISQQGLLFSERYGYTKFLKLGKWKITLLSKA